MFQQRHLPAADFLALSRIGTKKSQQATLAQRKEFAVDVEEGSATKNRRHSTSWRRCWGERYLMYIVMLMSLLNMASSNLRSAEKKGKRESRFSPSTIGMVLI